LYDDTDDLIIYNDDDPAGGTTDSHLDIILIDGGDYRIKVEDYFEADDPTFSYVMSVDAEEICDVPESSTNNDNFGNAGVLQLTPGDTACGIIDNGLIFFDDDYFSLAVDAGDQVIFDILAIEGSTSGLDCQLTLFDTDGTSILQKNEPSGNVDPYFQYTFNTAGTYYINIESDGLLFNTEGPYLLETSLVGAGSP
ncbi:MAG TPA: hypothetical protein DIU15_21245, partial [Deltaproteobacteria bacterium]|nr:hypothetical protein [Deltaproteobacteria bacterium]